MTGVEGWMWKHYTRENPDSVKCDHCGEVFSNRDRMQNLTFHLCDEHNITELDEHPERDSIQQNYEISRWQLMAICNHCKKRINLAIHGVHILTIHLKIFHSDKCNLKNTEKKKLCICDKFNQTDNHATYKGCKSTIKINDESIKIKQTRHFRCFKNAHSSKYKLKKIRRILRVRDIYDKVDDNHMRCKRCKKTIKLGKETPIIALNKHLHRCRYLKIKDTIKNKLRRSRIWDKYDKINNSYAKCKICKKLIKIGKTGSLSNLYKHLHFCRNNLSDKHKLDRIRKTSRIWELFDEVDDNYVLCKQCEILVKLWHGSTATLHQHLRYCSNFEITPKCKLKGSRIWDKFDKIDDTYVKCKECEKTLKINKESSTSNLNQHLRHCRRFIEDPVKYKGSRIWDKYDKLSDTYAKCKGCEKRFKRNKLGSTSNLHQHLRYCRSAQTSPRSMDDNNFHGNDPQSVVQTNVRTQPLKQKREDTEESDESWSSTETDEDLLEALMKSKTKTKINFVSRKRRTDIINESYSSSEFDEDLREALMKSKTETKVYNLRKRPDVVDKTAPSTSRTSSGSSSGDEDFHDTM